VTGGIPSSAPQTPLGGRLIDRVLVGDALEEVLERVPGLPRIMVDREAEISFEMIATGVFSPLVGSPSKVENECIVQTGRLLDGTPWPIPFSFAPAGRRNAEVVRRLREGDEVVLIDRAAKPVAVMGVKEIYEFHREDRGRNLFGTSDPRAHPGVASIFHRMGGYALSGPIDLIERASWGAFERHRLTPRDTYDLFYTRRGYKTVAGFVTGANPPHLGHEHMHRVALELVDAILLLPQVEMERPEYIRPYHRLMSLEALADVYYPPLRVILSALRAGYLFAGPREAVLHALIMRNYGCTHALIGRDHAGVGDMFDLYASQHVFDEYEPGELGIEPVFFSEIFYCTRCRATATERTCPHDTRYRIQISGTGIREVLRRGYLPPKEICRPEVSHMAIQGVEPPTVDEDGQSVYPVGQTMHSLFPFYEVATRLGGYLRSEIVPYESLGDRDLEAALLDVRTHADQVYQGVFDEIAAASEVDRTLAERWRVEAREILVDHQAEVVQRLCEQVQGAKQGVDQLTGSRPEEAADDLQAARQVLAEHPRPLHPEQVRRRVTAHEHAPAGPAGVDGEPAPPGGGDPGDEPAAGGCA
jgi:sulfate adenylyltransferase